MTTKLKHFLSAGVAWLAAIWIFVFTMNLSSGSGSIIGPSYVPRLVALLLCVLGIGMFLQGMRTPVTAEEKETIAAKKAARKGTPLIERLTPVLTLALITLFLFALRPIGFTTSATVYLTLQMKLLSGDFKWKSWLKYAIIGVVCAVVILLLFRYGFSLKLPVNSLGF